MTTEQIIDALLKASPTDLRNIRLYMQWMKIRRRVNHHFYLSAHWVQPAQKRYHWI